MSCLTHRGSRVSWTRCLLARLVGRDHHVDHYGELEEAQEDVRRDSCRTIWRLNILPGLRPALVAAWISMVAVAVRELSSSVVLVRGDSMVPSAPVCDLYKAR